jgi:hypothetical protein
MTGFTNEINRHMKFMGTMGEIEADMHKNTIIIQPFGKEKRVVDVAELTSGLAGHGGGDQRMVQEFLTLIRDGVGSPLTAAQNSADSHLACFAAEYSRLRNGLVVDVNSLPNELK